MTRFSRFIIAFLLLFVTLASPVSVQAADISDPAVTDLVIIPDEPAPDSEVDFLVAYSNHGSQTSQPLSILVDFDENVFKRIVVGNSSECVNTGITVSCNTGPLDSGASGSVGFTGYVKKDAQIGDKATTYASIKESGNVDDITNNNLKELTITIGRKTKQVVAASATGTTNAELLKTKAPLESPSGTQDVSLFSVENDPNWRVSGLYTAGLKFIIRGKEAFAWSLGIDQTGFTNPAIRQNYAKVLTVVNSLFIIGLLVIAVMWIFSLLIPRKVLKRVILVYAMAVVFVNFALPINQLFIDGSGLLQKTFITDVDITKIAKTPNYNDQSAVGYLNQAGHLKTSQQNSLSLSVSNENSDSTVSTPVGRIGQGHSSLQKPSYIGTIMIPIADEKGNIVKVEEETVQLRATADQVLSLDAGQKIALINDQEFNPNREHTVFTFLMFILTGLAYFGMALLFILRIVVLWALMIISPVLFFLAVFKSTRGYFVSWLGIYARWLFIGPLLALGIGIVVNIWEAVGLPITSTYLSTGEFGLLTNIGFYLPGSDTINTLSNTPQMMEYLLFLIMLYLPLLFAFMLTRQKFWSAAANLVVEKAEALQQQSSVPTEIVTEERKEGGGDLREAKSLVGGVKGFLGTQLNKLQESSIPDSMRKSPAAHTSHHLEAGSSQLSEHMTLTPIKELLDMTSEDKRGSRGSRQKSIETLASPESIADPGLQKTVMSVRQEIDERAGKGDSEAVRVVSEIHAAEGKTSVEGGFSNANTPNLDPQRIDVEVKLKDDEKRKAPEPSLKLDSEIDLEDEDSEPAEEEGERSSRNHKPNDTNEDSE